MSLLSPPGPPLITDRPGSRLPKTEETPLKYQPLEYWDSIRLLCLQPRSESSYDEDIKCTIEYRRVSDFEDDLASHYVALSYVWGEWGNSRVITVDGVETPVTENLFCALRDVRHAEESFYLWVDAICINQVDLEERNEQVRLMGTIYATATKSIIYLGESDRESERAIRALRQPYPQHYRAQDRLKDGIVATILQRPWFTRVWVLQELALSQNPIIQCGPHRVKWDKLGNVLGSTITFERLAGLSIDEALSIFADDRSQAPLGLRLAEQMHMARQLVQLHKINSGILKTHSVLLGLVASRRGLGASDSRDMLYAHFGMKGRPLDIEDMGSESDFGRDSEYQRNMTRAADEEDTWHDMLWGDELWLRKSFPIHYEKSIQQVYNTFAAAVISNSERLAIMHHIEAAYPQEHLKGLASWAPDWTLPRSHRINPLNFENGVDPFRRRSCHEITEAHGYAKDRSVLGILGYSGRKITHLSDIITWNDDNAPRTHQNPPLMSTQEMLDEYLSVYDRWRNKLGREKVPLPDIENELVKSYEQIPQPGRRTEDRLIRDAFRAIETKNNLLGADRVADLLVVFSRGKYSGSIVGGRRVAMLEDGEPALVPAGAAIGDYACVVNLHEYAVVLRSHPYKGSERESVEEELKWSFKNRSLDFEDTENRRSGHFFRRSSSGFHVKRRRQLRPPAFVKHKNEDQNGIDSMNVPPSFDLSDRMGLPHQQQDGQQEDLLEEENSDQEQARRQRIYMSAADRAYTPLPPPIIIRHRMVSRKKLRHARKQFKIYRATKQQKREVKQFQVTKKEQNFLLNMENLPISHFTLIGDCFIEGQNFVSTTSRAKQLPIGIAAIH